MSISGVNGWYSANQRSAVGIESVGTNPLPRNGSRTNGMPTLLAGSTDLLARPNATDSQMKANVIITRKAIRASQSPPSPSPSVPPNTKHDHVAVRVRTLSGSVGARWNGWSGSG
ncbi:hypothetical protein SAMN05660209_05170 [Geodermatophilus africanus]|uniref:Uncharacterized protein n=1 Tax=Geodermatophilus africanus TaxID=1137993 RepID=A0A1H3RI59_9ACTN|nr:hypothetical protein SAMN05660209_05170 [Geodermatophilus africanus]